MAEAVEQNILQLWMDTSQSDSALSAWLKKTRLLDSGNEEAVKSTDRLALSAKKLGGASGGLKDFIAMGAGAAAGAFGFSAIVGAIKNMASSIPAVSMAFDVMGRTIQRNLVWPLFKSVLPLLQKMVNWVADNRLAFVRLGVVLEGIFKTVGVVFKAAFRLVKGALEGMFGAVASGQTIFRNIIDYIQLALLKFAAAVIFLEIILEPVFKKIGGAIRYVWEKIASPFINGLVKGFSGPATGAITGFITLAKKIGGVFDQSEITDFAGSMERFGTLLGRVWGTSLERMAQILNVVFDLFGSFARGVLSWLPDMTGAGGGFLGALESIWKISEFLFPYFLKGLNMLKPVLKVIGNAIGFFLFWPINLAVKAVRGLIANWEFFTESVPQMVGQAVGEIRKFFKDIRGSDIVKGLETAVRGFLSAPWKAVGKGIEFIKDKTRAGINIIKSWIGEIPNKFRNIFNILGDRIKKNPVFKFFQGLFEAGKEGVFKRILEFIDRSEDSEPKRKKISFAPSSLESPGAPSAPLSPRAGPRIINVSVNVPTNINATTTTTEEIRAAVQQGARAGGFEARKILSGMALQT